TMDSSDDFSSMSIRHVVQRALIFLGYLIGFMLCTAVIGLLPTIPILIVAFMRLEGREPWRLVLGQAAVLTLGTYVLFDRLLQVPWPQPLLSEWLPILRMIPSM